MHRRGLHVTVALAGKHKWPVVKQFAGDFADEMVAAAPDAYVATMTKAKRTGKIFIDYFRNDYTATAIADYSVRARPGAPVGGAAVVGRTERTESSQRLHDEGCAEAAEEPQAARTPERASPARYKSLAACRT
jgi:DNA primase